jgi:uncharacterized iron-regulated membrane protein
MTMQSLRRMWLQCHRWVALCLGWLLVLAGITGSLLVVARPVDQWLHPEFFVAAGRVSTVAAPAIVSLESLRQRLAAEFGLKAAFTFRPPQEADETLQVLVRAQWRGTLYLNPHTGAEQGRRGENAGFVTLLYGLHSALLMDQTGKAVLACAALSYLFLLITGVVLWWPRQWPPSLRMEFGKGRTRALFDLHRTAGAVLALFLAISVGTGAYLAWRPIGGWISLLAGAAPVVAPKLPANADPAGHAGDASSLSLDELAARAQAVFPDGRIGYILYTPAPNRPLAIRFRVPDDPHPNGRSTVWLDPRNGAVLAAHRWSELDPGTRVNSYVYPLHTGELGGVGLQIAVGLLGLLLSVLGISGLWLWWRRRSARRAARHSLRAAMEGGRD